MNTATLVILGVAAMLLMAMGVILFVVLYQRRVIQSQIEIEQINRQKQQEMLNASIRSEEQERMRIASELHDDVAPTLASIKLYLSSALQQNGPSELLVRSKSLLDESLQKIRDIAHKLQPSTLHYLGLEASLQALTDTLHKSASIEASYSSAQPLPRIAANTELSLYRIVQELVNNILKHAHPGKLELSVAIQADTLCLCLRHNGMGITQQLYEELIYKKGAIGLKNIVTRLKSIDAMIRFEQVSVSLFTVTVQAPIKTKN